MKHTLLSLIVAMTLTSFLSANDNMDYESFDSTQINIEHMNYNYSTLENNSDIHSIINSDSLVNNDSNIVHYGRKIVEQLDVHSLNNSKSTIYLNN